MLSSLKDLIFFLLFHIFTTISTQNYHPLDPLTPSELIQVQTIVKNHFSNTNHSVGYHYVGLDEPEKSIILSWQSNLDQIPDNPCRRAFVIARVDKKTHEIIVDLSSNFIVSDKLYDGHGYPIQNFGEQKDASKLAMSYPPLIASIEKRGLKLEEVICMSFTVGWYGEERDRRVVTVMCYYLDGTVNMYMRPIEGITVTVDLDEMKIIGFRDRIMVPVPKADGTDYRESMESVPKSSSFGERAVLQTDGPGFTLDGHILRYCKKCVFLWETLEFF